MNWKKLYFGLVSLVSVVLLAISSGIILSALGKMFLISNKEYLANNSWDLNTCYYEVQKEFCGNPIKDYNKCSEIQKTEEFKQALEKCKSEKAEKILARRWYNLKITLISAGSSFIVFLILFITHYRVFTKLTKQD